MAAQPWWHLPLIIAGWTLAAAGVLLLLWALFGDRSRGRRRCPRCWYDMSGAAGTPQENDEVRFTCPECGGGIIGERQLLKPRRRWRWVVVSGLLLLVAYAACVTPRVVNGGWPGAVPCAGLCALSPWLPERAPAWVSDGRLTPAPVTSVKESLVDELRYRVTSGTLGRIERYVLFVIAIERIKARDYQIGPRYGDHLDDWLYRSLSSGIVSEGLRDSFQQWLLARCVQMRDRWPEGVPPQIRLEKTSWLFDPRRELLGNKNSVSISANQIASSGDTPKWISIDTNAASPVVVTLPPNPWCGPKPPTISLSFRREPTLEACMRPVAVPGMDRLLADCITSRWLQDDGLLLDGAALRRRLPRGVGFAARCTLIADGRVLEATSGHAQHALRLRVAAKEWFRKSPLFTPAQRMQLVIEPEPSLALQELGCDRYWSGRVVLAINQQGKATLLSESDTVPEIPE